MAIKVTLGNTSRVTKREPADEAKLKFSRVFYQYLGSLIQNRNLSVKDEDSNIIGGTYYDDELPEEYKRLLDELNDLYLTKNYPELADGIELKEGIIELDEYLGSLGVTEEYPYSMDSVDIPAWIHLEEISESRILIDSTDDTYLTDTNGDILVAYQGE